MRGLNVDLSRDERRKGNKSDLTEESENKMPAAAVPYIYEGLRQQEELAEIQRSVKETNNWNR